MANYERRKPRHSDMEALMPSLGPVKEPDNAEDEVVERMDSTFMFDRFVGFEWGLREVERLLREYGIDPDSGQGQSLLATYVEHTVDEFYGDFDRSAQCESCGSSFQPTYSLDYVNLIRRASMIMCPHCAENRRPARTRSGT